MAEQRVFEYDLFISYAEEDSAWVEGHLLDALEQAGVTSIRETTFELGVPRLVEFERAVRSSKRTLLILTPTYLNKDPEFREFADVLAQTTSLERGTWSVIPLILQSVALPPRLSQLTPLPATGQEQWPGAIERLLRTLNKPLVGTKPKDIDCPYPGIEPFDVKNAHWFFGRDEEIDDLFARVSIQNFLIVIGPSGSGKSSLVFAGLVARLQKSQPGRWLLADMRPGADPLRADIRSIDDDAWLGEFHQLDVDRLLASRSPAQQLLLVIDQFEELFTQSPKPAQAEFIAKLKALRAGPNKNCKLMLTMRADFYSDLMVSDLWLVAPSQRIEIAPLRGKALEDALKNPADAVGVYLEPRLIEQLIRDAANEPGALPLLQETMILLWTKRQRRLLTARAYEQLGRDGASGLAVALSLHADAAYDELNEAGQAIARRILLRLIQFGEGRADTRRQRPVSDLRAPGDDPQLFGLTLRRLIDKRLLTSSGEAQMDSQKIDIAHEALIAGWPRLGEWIAGWRNAEQKRRMLENKAAEWVRFGRDQGGLLDDIELREAQEWLNDEASQDLGGPGSDLQGLIQASRQAIWIREQKEQWLQEERERVLRQERDTAQRLADAEQARAREAERVQLIALARALAIQAEQGAEGPELSLLFARQAYFFDQRSHGDLLEQIDTALRSALRSPNLAPVLHRNRDAAVSTLEFSPDGHWLAAGYADGAIQLWDVTIFDCVSLVLNGGRTTARVLPGDGDRIQCMAFSPDSQRLAVLNRAGTACLYDLRDDSRVLIGQAESFARQPSPPVYGSAPPDSRFYAEMAASRKISTIAFSPDGQVLAIPDAQYHIQLWELRQGQTPTLLRTGPPARSLVFANDHTIIIWESLTVRFWDLRQPEVALTTLNGQNYGIPAAHEFRGSITTFPTTVSSDGRFLALTSSYPSSEGSALLWNLREPGGQRKRGFSCWHPGAPRLSGDGRRLACLAGDELWVWDVDQPPETAFSLHYSNLPLRRSISSFALSHDGQIVACEANGTIGLWYFQQPDSASRILATGQAAIRNVTWSPDGRMLTWSDSPHTLSLQSLYDTTCGPILLDGEAAITHSTESMAGKSFQDMQKRALQGVQELAYQKWLAAGQPSGRDTEFWLAAEAEFDRLAASPNLIFGPEDQVHLCFVTKGGQVCVAAWKWRDPAIAPQILHGPSGLAPHDVLAFGCDPGGRLLLLTAGEPRYNKLYNLWNLRSPDQPIHVLEAAQEYAIGAFSPDGRTFVAQMGRSGKPRTGGWRGSVVRWDLEQGQQYDRQLNSRDHNYCSMAFSADSRQLALGSAYEVVKKSRTSPTSQLLEAIQVTEAIVVVFALSHESARQRYAGPPGLVSPLFEAKGHRGDISAVAFHPGGQGIASGSLDQTIRLWNDLKKPERSRVLTAGHEGGVSALAFSPDGKLLASGGEDRTLRISVVDTAPLAEIVEERVSRNLTIDEWRRFVGEHVPYERTCGGLPAGEGAPSGAPSASEFRQ